MDEQNGNCFDHPDLYVPLAVSDTLINSPEHDCLKDFLLEPSQPVVPPSSCALNAPIHVPMAPNMTMNPWGPTHYQQPYYNNICQNAQPPPQYFETPVEVPLMNHHNMYNVEQDMTNYSGNEVPLVNGECWSPATFTASTSERTVSSDCVSSEPLCSPGDVIADSPSPFKPYITNPVSLPIEEPQKKRGRKKRDSTHKTRSRMTYESQISPEENGIKLKIKKSIETIVPRARKRKQKEESPIEIEDEHVENCEPDVQSAWGDRFPKLVLHKVFELVTRTEGCVPFLVRAQRVCRLWREVAISPDLWHHVDLSSTWVGDRARNALKFRWLCENRLSHVQDLNIGGWEFDGIPIILDKLASTCHELKGISFSGWQGLSGENIRFLISHCRKLKRLDLSGINPEMNNPRSAVSMMSIQFLAQEMGENLTHLTLSDNKLSGIPQIITAISTHCPNIEVLDLSNVRTVSQNTANLNIEKLQLGCPNLRVLRLTNSELTLSSVSFKEQSLSEGFPHLEELSVAGAVDQMSSRPIVDDDSLARILKSSCKLRLLDVRGCSRLTDSSLVRVPAWDLEHLFLSGCFVTRVNDSGLEHICQKWAHSLIEVDLAWSTATQALDSAVTALAKYVECPPLRVLNLCGSSIDVTPVKSILTSCPNLYSINLQSCRALPRGLKRHYHGFRELQELRNQLLAKDEEESTNSS